MSMSKIAWEDLYSEVVHGLIAGKDNGYFLGRQIEIEDPYGNVDPESRGCLLYIYKQDGSYDNFMAIRSGSSLMIVGITHPGFIVTWEKNTESGGWSGMLSVEQHFKRRAVSYTDAVRALKVTKSLF